MHSRIIEYLQKYSRSRYKQQNEAVCVLEVHWLSVKSLLGDTHVWHFPHPTYTDSERAIRDLTHNKL